MLLRKAGFPEDSELVICTVTKINPGSVFVNIDEYDRSGLIHISEISPGRIRNIRDYVKEGKKVVCKVLHVDSNKGHIDLSLRRVSDGQRRKKVDELKQQQKSEKIIEFVAKKQKQSVRECFMTISNEVLKDYDSLYSFFMDIVDDNVSINEYISDKVIAKEIEELVKQRIKPSKVEVKGKFVIESYAPNGVEIIKDAFKEIKNIDVKYVGGGIYGCSLTSSNYKDAEKLLEEDVNLVLKYIEENNGIAEFERIEK